MPRTCAACRREGHIISHDVVDPARRLALRPASGGMVWSPDVHWDPMNPRSPDAEEVDRFCEICVPHVLTMCESGGAAITRGPLIDVRPGPFCRNCGRPHGWATREEKIDHLNDQLAAERTLSEADRQRLRSALNELAQSDPLDEGKPHERLRRAVVVVKDVAGEAYDRVVVPVLAETLSRTLRAST